MTILPLPRLSANSAVAGVLRPDPALEAATLHQQTLSERLRDTTGLLEMPRSERLNRCSPDLYGAYRQRAVEKHAKLGYGVAMATMFGGGAVGAALLLHGYGNAASLCGLGTLLATFWAVPRLYCAAVIKWVLPGEIDRNILPQLRSEQEQLKAALPAAEANVTAVREQLAKRLYEEQSRPAPAGPRVEVEEATVTINGVKIRVRR